MPRSLVSEDAYLSEAEIAGFVAEACADLAADGKRVLFVIPDSTRSMPMPLMFRCLCDALLPRARAVDFLIALGTHPPMPDEAIHRMLGISAEERATRYARVGLYNHAWDNPDELTTLGTLSGDEVAALTGGRMHDPVAVQINRRVRDYDLLCVVGPVFPHEVVGFSGGNKYFFPGISGPDVLNLFHWLGALITNYRINGTKRTPVRDVIDRAAAMIPVEKRCFCLNVMKADTKGIFFGTPEEAWSPAADLAARTHMRYYERPFHSVLAMAPAMYDEIWVAGKCMYKLEPVIADGGELIIYGPHIREVSITHGPLIRRIGYHVRDYFLAQMDRFADVPGGILAHSTHVRGAGTFVDGVERPRVQVTLATAIPEAECRAINLGYRDPATIDPEAWRGREDEGYLLVPSAGEILYRLTSHPGEDA
jgi:nickel-dependent lactate racemase